jgi:hypothetical protein
MSTSAFGVAIFPYLRTSGRVHLGRYEFRSTTDLEDLPADQRVVVEELSAMLFLRDDLHIDQASFTITPGLGSIRPDPTVRDLARVRTVVAYLYSSPHPTFGDVLLTPEDVSLLAVQPAEVTVYLTRNIRGATHVGPPPQAKPDKFGDLSGYEGVFNNSPIWLESGSRIYGPRPQMTLNISQDLAADLSNVSEPSEILLRLLAKEPSPFSERILTALDWYNCANEKERESSQSLLHLAVAFETLLQLPASEKTDRLSDAISLLLGRTDRLKDWAVQFYAQRSAVAHSGRASDWWFYGAGAAKQGTAAHPFGNLMTYGRQVFQLCVKTVLLGAHLAEEAGLKDRFIANSERYELICRLVTEGAVPDERLRKIAHLVDELGAFRFVPSGSLTIELMVGAVRAASATLLEAAHNGSDGLLVALKAMSETNRKDGDFEKLSALERLAAMFKEDPPQQTEPSARVVASLVEHAWGDLFLSYYRMKKAEERAAAS